MTAMGTAYPRGRFPSRVGIGGKHGEGGVYGLRRPPIMRRNFISLPFTGRFAITGVTRDSTGTPLGNCTVVLLRWDAFHGFIAETQSDGSGNFTFDLGRSDGPCHIVAYKDGAPDVAGTTVNELVPVQA